MSFSRDCYAQEKGMTLLELVLAMVILVLVTLAGNAVASSSLRMAKLNSEKTGMQADVQYVFREFENDLQQLNFQNPGLSFFYDDTKLIADHKVRYLVIADVEDAVTPGLVHLRLKREYVVTYDNATSSVVRNECSNTTDYDPNVAPALKVCTTAGAGGRVTTLYRGELIEPEPTAAPIFEESNNLVTMRLQLKRKIAAWPGTIDKMIQTQVISRSVYVFGASD